MSGATAVREDDRAPLAALLSFLVPGLGQAYNRDFRLAALLVLPAVVALALLLAAAGKGTSLLAALLDIRVLVAVIVLDIGLLGWRLVAIIQAHSTRENPNPRRWTTWVTVVIVVATLGMHLLPAWYASATIDTLTTVSEGGGGAGGYLLAPKDLLPAPPSHQPAPAPVVTPKPTPLGLTGQFTVLLLGIDSGPERNSANTDTMLVAVLDPRSGPAMISIPRDMFGVPLGDGREYYAKLNSLMALANLDPATYPLGGVETLKAAVGELLGVHIDYVAAVDMLGFTAAVDALGGIDVDVLYPVHDFRYRDEYNQDVGFHIEPGTYHMDGYTALAFARSRYGAGDNDFTRAARQQQILAALAAKVTGTGLLLNLPTLLDAVSASVATDIPLELLPHVARSLLDADLSAVEGLVIQYPLAYSDNLTDGTYVLIPDIEAIHAAVDALLARTPQPRALPGD